MNEPIGVVGIVCPEEPGLLAFVSLMGAAIATGNAAVMVPSMAQALVATDFYQILDTSDLPGGVINIVTGDKGPLGLELAKHDAVDAIWYFGNADAVKEIELASAGNLKQTWTESVARDWGDANIGGGAKSSSARLRSRTSGFRTGSRASEHIAQRPVVRPACVDLVADILVADIGRES